MTKKSPQKHPLPYRHVRDDVVDQVSGGLRHPVIFSPTGNTLQVTDPASKVWTYTFNAGGILETVLRTEAMSQPQLELEGGGFRSGS